MITTVNVQHLESIADAVERMTGSRVRERVPDWVVRTVGRFVPALGTFADLLGPPKAVSAEKATKVLGWQPRSAAVTVAETGKSLLALRESVAIPMHGFD